MRYLSQMPKMCLKKKLKDLGHCKHDQYSEQVKKRNCKHNQFPEFMIV